MHGSRFRCTKTNFTRKKRAFTVNSKLLIWYLSAWQMQVILMQIRRNFLLRTTFIFFRVNVRAEAGVSALRVGKLRFVGASADLLARHESNVRRTALSPFSDKASGYTIQNVI